MKRCPITLELIDDQSSYSRRGLSLLSRGLKELKPLPYSAEEQQLEALARAGKISIQGVQPKLSARLSVKEGTFELVDRGGTFILKPPHPQFESLPENEALTMRLAQSVGIRIPDSGLVYARDGTLSYFIRRFDRFGHRKKRLQEDFAQLTDRTRETKYDSSVEQVIDVIDLHCTFPAIERIELFRRLLFAFLTGNEDMHLKNYSLLCESGTVTLSPAYDLLNTTIALPAAQEETALTLKGRKKNQTHGDFFEYLAKDRLKINNTIIGEITRVFRSALDQWPQAISTSFLPTEVALKYQRLVESRRGRFGW